MASVHNQHLDKVGRIDLLKSLASQKEIEINIDIPEDMNIKADKNMIKTVIRNIVTNAIKFTEKGTISIYSEIEDHKVKIQIADSGIGIPKNKLASLFEVEKSKSTKGTRGEQGTGLGLIICKEFLEKNNGAIHVKSEQGAGSTFSFTIPIAKNN